MKEGFYFREHTKFGVILYEYRNGILSCYSNIVTWTENGKLQWHKLPEYGWILSNRTINEAIFYYLEDL